MYVSICVVLTAGVHVARGIDSVKLNGRSDQEVINVCAQLQTSHARASLNLHDAHERVSRLRLYFRSKRHHVVLRMIAGFG